MAARRGVGAAGRAGNEAARRAARARVHDAKTALGERGTPWWEPAGSIERIEATIRTLLRHRTGGTICPSDVARTVGGERWRSLLPEVRSVAFDLARRGRLSVRQRGAEVTDVDTIRGPVRLGATERLPDILDHAG